MIPDLVAFTPGDRRDVGPWLRALGSAGLPGVIVREPALDLDELRVVAAIAQDAVPFVALHAKNPHASALAAALQLPLHVPAAGRSPGPFGASCHSAAEVEDALAAGARYATLSPVWAPLSKPRDVRTPLGLPAFLAAAAGRPVLALGGATPERLRAVLAAGGHGVAVLGALSGPDPVDALGRFLAVRQNTNRAS